MKLMQYGNLNLMRIGAVAIRRDEIIAVQLVINEDRHKAYVWQTGQKLTDVPLEILLSKEEYESIQAEWGVPSIA